MTTTSGPASADDPGEGAVDSGDAAETSTNAEHDADARALASSLRIRVLRLCKDTPRTNREMATALGVNPATLLHHVRLLTDRGFLAAQPVRRGARGSRERPYLSTGKSWRFDGPPELNRVLVRAFLEELALADQAATRSVRLGVRLSAAESDELWSRMRALVQEYATREEDPDGEPLSLFVVLHQDVGRMALPAE